MTAGVDAWQSITQTLSARPLSLTGTLSGTPTISRRPSHNTGGFLQTQIGIKDRLYLTYGLRAEWNPNFGAAALPNYAPRYGVAYSNDIGPVATKLRASYGRSTRPPSPTAKLGGVPNFDGTRGPIYGTYSVLVGNADLGPEYQQGGEGGLELYFGRRASFVATRYNQTIEGLIAEVPGIDSVKSLQPNPSFGSLSCATYMSFGLVTTCSSQDADGYTYALLTQNLNAGSIRNQGWELQGHVNAGPFTMRGTYSWTKSRTIGITQQFRKYFDARVYPQYQPGALFLYLPEHTWAGGITYAYAHTTIGLNVTGNGRITNLQSKQSAQYLNPSIRLPVNRASMSTSGYINFTAGATLADLNITHQLSSKLETVFQVQNLANQYTNEYSATYLTLGRQIKGGFRLRAL